MTRYFMLMDIMCLKTNKFLFLVVTFLMTFSCLDCFEIVNQNRVTNKLGYGNFNISQNGELLLMKQVLKPGYRVFDVGANIGEWSLDAISVEPSIRIAAFEPIPSVFEILKKNLRQHPNATAWNLALSDQKGRCEFYHYDSRITDTGLSGLYPREVLKGVLPDPKVIEVEQDMLINFCSDTPIEKIDYLKIDTEGAEWRILKGAEPLLKQGRIGALQFEYGGTYVDANTTLEQIYRLLTANNYLVFRIIPSGLVHISQWDNSLENYVYSNYFAVLKSEFSRYFPSGYK